MRANMHRDSWRRFKTGATKEDRRLRASIGWSAAIAAVIVVWHFV